jgi:hypothetical protein
LKLGVEDEVYFSFHTYTKNAKGKYQYERIKEHQECMTRRH